MQIPVLFFWILQGTAALNLSCKKISVQSQKQTPKQSSWKFFWCFKCWIWTGIYNMVNEKLSPKLHCTITSEKYTNICSKNCQILSAIDV